MSNAVVVVGAGPAGAALAYLLARNAIDVTLLERRRDFAREFRGEVLMPSGVDAFQQMGLLDALSALPSALQEHVGIYLNGQPIVNESIDAGQLPIRAISQPALLEMLVEQAAQYPAFTLIRGAAVKEIMRSEAAGRRVIGVRVGTDDGEQVIPATLVVGADGRNSVVRKATGLRPAKVSPPMDIVWCQVPLPVGWRGFRAYAGGGHLLLAYQKWDAALQFGWVILKGHFGELRERGIEEWVQEMAKQVSPDLAAHLHAHAADIRKPFLLDVVSDCVTSWSVPGALLIGDAAHTMSPVGGQGINVALRDAMVAANHLVPLLLQPALADTALDAGLRAIEAERMPEIDHIQRLQELPPKLMLSQAWWGDGLRWVAGKLLSLSAVRARAMSRANVFLNGVTEVALKV